MTRLAGDRGSMAIQAVMVAPAVLLLLGLALVGLRFYTADSAVREAARSAARAASIAHDGTAAASAATGEAHTVLAQQGLVCSSMSVTVDAADFVRPIGETGFVTATVSCSVPLADLLVPGLSGEKTATAVFRSPIDRYGARR